VLRRVTATRYVTPLREGGSLPGLMEADDLGTYVVKFVGAGQGRKTLVAEVICAGLARAAGLRVPELVAVDLDPALAAGEPDQEVQDLLRASAGLNLGVDFLPGALDLDRPATVVDSDWAARLLWFDAFVGNVDRSWRNPNLLLWHGDLWVIDHGASLYFHHGWSGGITDPARFAHQSWDVDDHVLRAHAGGLARADEEITALLDEQVFADVLADVPDPWLEPVPGADTPDALREAYVSFLVERLSTRQWLPAAEAA